MKKTKKVQIIVISSEITLTTALCCVLARHLENQFDRLDETPDELSKLEADSKMVANSLGLPLKQVEDACSRLIQGLAEADVLEAKASVERRENDQD